MKILHVGQMVGGLDVYIRNTITYNKADNEFVIVCGKEDKHLPVIKDGVEIKEHHIPLFRSLNPLNDLRALAQTVAIIRKEKPDLIHCHSAKGGIIGRTAGWITHTKTFYTPHAFSYLCSPSHVKRKIYLLIERLTKFNSHVLACSKSEQQMAIDDVGYKACRARVWHNAVPDASQEKGTLADVSEPYACYIGRPCYQKNTLFLVDVIKRVKEQGCLLKFILLGVGYHSPELEVLEKKIAEYHLEETISLLPWLSHADCQEYVRQSLFYVTTALYEGLPLAVIEAMANGKAIIASDVVGNKDCVHDGENGYLLPLDAEAFAEKIATLTVDSSLRTSMQSLSREIFEGEFLIDKMISRLQNEYAILLSKQHTEC